jgi:hypothetical protein
MAGTKTIMSFPEPFNSRYFSHPEVFTGVLADRNLQPALPVFPE